MLLSLTMSVAALLPAQHTEAQVTHTSYSRAGLGWVETAEAGVYEIQAPFEARSVGLWWQGELVDARLQLWAGDVAVRGFETIVESHDLSPSHAGAIGPAGTARVSGLMHGDGARVDAVRLQLTDLAALEELTVVWIPWFQAPAAATQPTPRTGPGTHYPQPPIYDRASWGADPPQCSSGSCAVTHIALHHTAGASEYSSPNWSTSAANVRAIQDFHMYTRGWCDIGYHYLVDVHGNIFEGRAGDGIRGAHDGHNCGSMAISMMGYFHTPHNQTLTAAMKDAYAELAAWKCDEKNINPLGTSYYAGYGANMTNLYGHRNVSSTACPGDLAYNELPSLRQEVDDRLNGGGGNQPIVLDTDALNFVGSWNTGTSASGKYGPDYRWASTGTARAIAYWRPNIPSAGRYGVQFWYPQGSNRNPAALHGVRINGTTYTGTINQQINGGQWVELGEAFLPKGTSTLIGLDNTGSSGFVVIADALRLVPR